MNVTDLAQNALLDASCKFAEAAQRRLQDATPADAEQAIRLLKASVMAFKACSRADDRGACPPKEEHADPLDLSTEEGWRRAALSVR